MNELIKYTEDKNFVRWVLEPDKELDSYWEKYKNDNPDQLEQIEEARVILLQLESRKEDISENEIDNLFSEIMEGVNKVQNKKLGQTITLSVLKYAAAVVFIIALGIGYNSFRKIRAFENVAQGLISNNIDNLNGSQLILANGEKIDITEKNSLIEYLEQSKFVINRIDTINISNVSPKDFNHLLVPRGNNSVLKLADGSIVHINAESQLIFPSTFNKEKRQVYLVGEGFFEIAHNPEVPFITSTNNLEVEVLGTKFNLSTYPEDEIVETYLLEGKVKVKEARFKLAPNDYVLNPFQSVTFNKENEEFELSTIEDSEYVSWYKGYLSFSSKSLSSITKNLERYFDVEIKLSSAELSYILISGKLKIKGEQIDTVLQVLANTANLELEKIDKSVYLLK